MSNSADAITGDCAIQNRALQAASGTKTTSLIYRTNYRAADQQGWKRQVVVGQVSARTSLTIFSMPWAISARGASYI